MNLRISTGLVAFGCILLASCYPYNENNKKKTKAPENATATAEQKTKEQAEALKKKQQDEIKKKEETPETNKPDENTNTGNTTETKTQPPAEKRNDFAFANKVPGKEGFVFSPYNNKVVDVRDIPSGTLVQDPTYPAAEKKYFRVP